MAQSAKVKSQAASPTNLVCKIINIEPDPKHAGRMLVAVRIDDGNGEPWVQGFSISPPASGVITVDEFIESIYTRELKRPVDPFSELKAANEKKLIFCIELPGNAETVK